MTSTEPHVHGYTAEKDALLKRLARIEGQVRGIAKMIDDDRYCIDILTQLGAVDTALEQVAIKVLESHVEHCVAGAMASGDPAVAAEKSRELLAAVQRFAKTRERPTGASCSRVGRRRGPMSGARTTSRRHVRDHYRRRPAGQVPGGGPGSSRSGRPIIESAATSRRNASAIVQSATTRSFRRARGSW